MPVTLGRSPYWIGGILGGATAKIVPDDAPVPPGHGVYTAWAHGYPAAVNVGSARRSRLVAACSWRHTFETVDALVGQMRRVIVDRPLPCHAQQKVEHVRIRPGRAGGAGPGRAGAG